MDDDSDDDSSAYSKSTDVELCESQSIAKTDKLPKYVINLKEKNPFRAFLLIQTLPDEMVNHVLNDGEAFLPVWATFENIVDRTYHLTKTGLHEHGFSYHVLMTIIRTHLDTSESPRSDFTRRMFCIKLIIDARFPRDIAKILVRDWEEKHFKNDIATWQMIIGVQKLIDAYRSNTPYPRIHEHVEAMKFDWNE